MKFKISESIATISPYEPGRPLKSVKREYNLSHVIKLASNENPIGFSPQVYDAVAEQMKDMNRYPESAAPDLTARLVEKFHVRPQNIVLGNGSDDIIALLAHGFLNPGDEALMPWPSFLMYEISVKTAKGVPVRVPLKDYAIDFDGLLKKITGKTRLIFITNPFNPTGSAITRGAFNKFSNQVPKDVIIVVDEAYIEFVRDKAVYNALQIPLQDPRIVTLRTFSKAYGLAGFRIGYGIMDDPIAEIVNRIRQPFNVNSLAQAAAVAAMGDEQFLKKSLQTAHDGLDFLAAQLAILGIHCFPTQSNFLMLDLKTDAARVFEQLLEQGVIVRSLKSYGFDTFLRVNTGTDQENTVFIQALKRVLKK